MDGNTAIAKILKAEGVEWMACYPMNSLIDAAAKEGIRPIICRQERAGVNMADGFSRVMNGNKIGVFCMQRGPGAENAFGGVAQGYADSVPFLLIPGGHSRDRIGVHPGFDSFAHYGGITKWVGHINLVERTPEMMRQAFSQLKNGRPGPVLVEVPEDVQTEKFMGDLNYDPVTSYKSAASREDVRDLVRAMLGASCPVINAGQGVLYAEATKELVELAELTNIPVLTTLAGKSGFPENHRLSLGTGANSSTLMVKHFLEKTDFVFGIGTSFTLSIFNAPMPQGAILAQSTNCAEDVNKDYRVNFGAIGDSKLVLQQMIDEVKSQIGKNGRPDTNGVVAEISVVKKAFMDEWGPRLNSNEIPLNPYRVFTELAKEAGSANVIITHDSGYPRDQLVPFWETVSPRGYIGWGKSTQLGYGLGLALGAKLAAPEKTVINVMGDAAFGMAGLDIETAVRSNIPIITIILNNGVMTHYDENLPYASKHWGINRLSGNYTKVALGLGAYAERVETPDKLRPSIQRALKETSSGRPAVLEMMTKAEVSVPKTRN